MNKVILMGRLTRDPEIRQTAMGYDQTVKYVARFTLAVDRPGARDLASLVKQYRETLAEIEQLRPGNR